MTTTALHVDELPAARAYTGPPCPGRTLELIVVMTCPHCSGMHHHRGVWPLGRHAERRCPTTGRLYRLGPIHRRRTPRRPVRGGAR